MDTVEIEFSELDLLKKVGPVEHRKWPAVFSCNEYNDLWLFITYGYTAPEDRIDVRGKFPVLDAIADEYLEHRPRGGRFFVSDEGAFFNEGDGQGDEQFIKFKRVFRRRNAGD